MSSSRFPPSTHLQTLADLLGRAQSVLALVAARGVGRRARKTAFTLYVLRLFLVIVLVLVLEVVRKEGPEHAASSQARTFACTSARTPRPTRKE